MRLDRTRTLRAPRVLRLLLGSGALGAFVGCLSPPAAPASPGPPQAWMRGGSQEGLEIYEKGCRAASIDRREFESCMVGHGWRLETLPLEAPED